MKLAVKSLPSDYDPDPTIPPEFKDWEETDYPGLKDFWCGNCNEVVQASGFRDQHLWHYRVICPKCQYKASAVYRRFKLPEKPSINQKQKHWVEDD